MFSFLFILGKQQQQKILQKKVITDPVVQNSQFFMNFCLVLLSENLSSCAQYMTFIRLPENFRFPPSG